MNIHLSFLLLATTLPYTMLAPARSHTFQTPHNQNVFLKRRQTEDPGYNRYYPQSPIFASFPNTQTHQHDHAVASIVPSSVKIRSPRIENPYANVYPGVLSQDAFTSSKSTFVRITPPPPPFIFSSTAYSTEPPIPSSPKSSPTPPSAVSSELPIDTTEPEDQGSAIDEAPGNSGRPSAMQILESMMTEQEKTSVNNNIEVGK